VEHEELVQLARPLLEAVPQGQPRKAPPSSYVGGDFRTAAPSPESHALLAFEVGVMI
jgi:mitochondrial-processing peptidase subunit alpha